MATLVGFILVGIATIASASMVTFEKTPDTIQTILTKYMTLTCAINDTVTSPSSSLVGRRSVKQTSTNVQFVTSLVVLRNGKEVATVTPFSPATAMQDKSKLNVTGSVAGGGTGHGGTGQLTLEWYYPDELQSGNYTCEVNGISATGHSVTIATSLNMPVRNPNMSDIIQHVHDQEIRIEEQMIKNKDLQKQLDNQKADIMALVESKLNQMKNDMDQKENKIMGMFNESRHFENGTVVCGGSNSWKTAGSYKTKEMTVQFKAPYPESPIVHVSPVHFDHYHTHYSNGGSAVYTDFEIELLNVTDTSFSLRCKTRFQNTYYYLNNFKLDWISIP